MKSYPFAAARVFGTPLAIHPTKGEVIARTIARRLNVDFDARGARATMGDDDGTVIVVDDGEAGYTVAQGVAIVDVSGTLVHKSAWLDACFGMRGYDAIRRDFLTALNDDNVRAVVLACDSPGGEVAGCFDLVDTIYANRGRKPVWAILDDSAYSACYAIASAADRITVPRTGGTGSVGVIAMHAEYSKALEGMGVEVTIFQYGDRKADGNEFNPLSKAARAAFQADVDTMGDLFVATVARNRNISSARVKATQAGTYLGASGVQVGFADAVQAPDEAFRSLLDELGT